MATHDSTTALGVAGSALPGAVRVQDGSSMMVAQNETEKLAKRIRDEKGRYTTAFPKEIDVLGKILVLLRPLPIADRNRVLRAVLGWLALPTNQIHGPST